VYLSGDVVSRLGNEPVQWRRQTIKSGSAFKGQIHFQVGQMEGHKFPSELREAQSARAPTGLGHGEGRRSPSPLWIKSEAYPLRKKINTLTMKSRIFRIFAN